MFIHVVDWPAVKRYLRLIATYVLIAAAVVVLYAPWGLALRPWDYELLRAGMSIIAGIALAGVFGVSTYLALKEPDVKLLEPAKIMSDEEVVPVLEEYRDAPVVGDIANEALEQIHSSSRKRKRLLKIISVQFAEGSMSWDKFVSMVDIADRTVLRNAALVANGVQSFDREGYAKARKRGSAQSEEVALYDRSVAGMQEVLEANDRVLLEMGKLELELTQLESGDTRNDASQTVEELQNLIEETKYYR